MVHNEQLNLIKSKKQVGEFIYPYYDGYSIAQILPTIFSALGVNPALGVDSDRTGFPFLKLPANKYKQAILFLIDGFGYNHFLQYGPATKFLKRLADNGNVYPITTIFPSTTAAAVTTYQSGLTTQEHGLPEWTVFFEELDQTIETLPFRPRGEEADILAKQGADPSILFNGTTVHEQLQSADIKSFVFADQKISHSAYSSTVFKGAEIVAFSDLTDLLSKLKQKLETEPTGYFYIYWSEIDSAEHIFGPHSPEHIQAFNTFFNALDEQLVQQIDQTKFADTLLMISADHGQVNVKIEDIIFLHTIPGLLENFQLNKRGQPILPTGSIRDLFMHVKPDKISETIQLLKNKLGNTAEVIPTIEGIKRGLFGLGQPTDRFLARVGNVLILPNRDTNIRYQDTPENTYVFLGMHGGLSEEEMIVPFGMVNLGEL